MPVSTFSMLIISAPLIFVKGAIFFCPADNGVRVVSVQKLVLSSKVCYTKNAAERRQGAACIDRWSCSRTRVLNHSVE